MAYLTTNDLAGIICEIAMEIRSDQWKKIAKVLESTIGIRDAVMHNQMIDDQAYLRLFDLRAEIFRALSPEPNNKLERTKAGF
jgi:hypothetical protein